MDKDLNELIITLLSFYIYKDTDFFADKNNISKLLVEKLSTENQLLLIAVYENIKTNKKRLEKPLLHLFNLAEHNFFEETLIELDKFLTEELEVLGMKKNHYKQIVKKLLAKNIITKKELNSFLNFKRLRNLKAHKLKNLNQNVILNCFLSALQLWTKLYSVNLIIE